ncbi:core-2/I-Branching enzyme [Rhodovulum imhoffii]|uniref:Peptide O-xylosyltransferase n=1 Tax=Rhodovulum imhoffii TaxID=365340 RepID=A0A2T5BS48_9RHOB|nr:DUF5928 domain-containing protein [Rhodovulum imhoffii]MBK5934706.1 glycosyl transferase [Rhodovulum imhoffii]PTN02130.1 core-2/I-Branching enzyme [Rhodovulum imhoffii]
MARIAYILLCHKDPESIVRQAERLTASGDYMAIHFDARATTEDYTRITAALAGNPGVVFARKRVKCGWGEWSLVRAMLNALEEAEKAFPKATHFYMLSGDCMPIKSADYAHAYLDAHDVDFIESFDFFTSDWIKTGLRKERLVFRHYFNERTQPKRFYAALEWQKKLGLTREIPRDIQVMIGSQWWCLRRTTIEAVLEFSRKRPDVLRFFSTTWIPDETFFQTLVRHLVPSREIRSRTLTFLLFSDYGMPVTFYNDHYDMLLAQDFLFARKISPEALELKRRLGALYASGETCFALSNEGRNLYRFLSGRGRIGQRFAPRFWEKETSLGKGRELLILTCKKWHVAKRLVRKIRDETGLPGVEYLFNEVDAGLPDLGGIETTVGKRMRHRRALMRMLFDFYDSRKLMICMDPSNIDLLQDLHGERPRVRVLHIQCNFSDEYLRGHARRVGIAGPSTPPEVMARLLPSIRNDFIFESDRLLDSDLPNLFEMHQQQEAIAKTDILADFLSIPREKAAGIAVKDQLFAD